MDIRKGQGIPEKLLCFLDYSKAFDCGSPETFAVLKNMGIPDHLTILMKNIKQEATVRTEYREMLWFKVECGIRQGCILSPYLFNLYPDAIFRDAGLADSNEGIKMGGRNVNNMWMTSSPCW